jgi:phosphoribosylanthranilate isomerase
MRSPEEVKMAIDAGITAAGFVTRMPSGAGIIEDQLAMDLCEEFYGNLQTWLLTSQTDETVLRNQLKTFKISHLQIVDYVDVGICIRLKKEFPWVEFVQVIHVLGEDDIERAIVAQEWASILLLDSGNPSTDQLGGTGNTHDWGLSKQIVEAVDVPVYLAGGLNPENVKEAIEAVNPAGVDVCSGLRKDGVLQAGLLEAFVKGASDAV